MITEKKTHRLTALLLSLATLALITVTAQNVVGLNAIAVALLYLLVVLTTSALADLACGIAAAVGSGLLVNYFFLPPFGTFYIEAPEDCVSFVAYTITAIVVSHFAATVHHRAVEADHLQTQLSRLSRFTEALLAVRDEDLTLERLTHELRNACELGYCAIFLFGETATASHVSSGIRPSRASQAGGTPPNPPSTVLEVIAEEGPDVRSLALKDQGKTIGTLVISQVSLAPEVADAVAATVSLVVRQTISVRSTG
ncbi:MAG: hypothetical protein A3K19_09390 [Lentisphaerae bacterium RIFOXYB12_FULL_65_16]|nr:MAG: hypothetical protein A3K18_22405 [Lentisphaerae bacterium RIFOXYA12_64_32]OGV90408.1 MAG: hypothetical protein A3K19_09390 [Lentisphaerae bacterium RIFOXYB12_FULL_65_16]